ncbi:hypothetical protein Droror1_Dr00019876, partial [Drosera rotundifolia]
MTSMGWLYYIGIKARSGPRELSGRDDSPGDEGSTGWKCRMRMPDLPERSVETQYEGPLVKVPPSGTRKKCTK